MPYKLLKFERDPLSVEPKYVALIEQVGFESQPFRVLVEHSKSVEEAKKDVEEWIATREMEDAAREAAKEAEKAESKEGEFLNELNASV